LKTLTWALVLLTLLAIFSSIHAIILSINPGLTTTFQPFLIGSFTGAIPVYVHLLISLIAALILLAVTSDRLFDELSSTDKLKAIAEKVDTLTNNQDNQQKLLESMQARIFLVDENLEHTRKEVAKKLDDQGEDTKQTLNASVATQQKLADDTQSRLFMVDSNMEHMKKDFSKGLDEQGEAIKQSQTNLVNRLNGQLSDLREEIARQLGEIKASSEQHEQQEKKAATAVLKQKDEITNVKIRLDALEEELATPKPELTSLSDTVDVKGIGPTKANELKEMGIATVGEFILTDPQVIAQGTSTSLGVVEKLQARAQLSMVPGVKGKDLILLEELSITSRRQLANQDPIDLSKRINKLFNNLVEKGQISEDEKPTIEEITSWVKFAKT
jgi:predicted flap endonuclease-1-like 5' DNA nuclease